MMRVSLIIPFRDRGTDPLRKANLHKVMEHWCGHYPMQVVSDGGFGAQQFNRSRAYNRGAKLTLADILIFAESDMIITYAQMNRAVNLAANGPGLVVPFTEYHYLSEVESALVRDGADPAKFHPEWTMNNGRSIGALNVMHRDTLEAVGGYDEMFGGNGWDDKAMRIAFDKCTADTRFVDGPAHHLYHLPGWRGRHLTDDDRMATRRNKLRYQRYQHAGTVAEIRALTMEGIA